MISGCCRIRLKLPRQGIAKAGKNRDGGEPVGFSSSRFTPLPAGLQENKIQLHDILITREEDALRLVLQPAPFSETFDTIQL